jgi:hypothetical protein
MCATTVKSSVVSAVDPSGVVPAHVATMMRTIVTVPLMMGTIEAFRQIEADIVFCSFAVRAHRLH